MTDLSSIDRRSKLTLLAGAVSRKRFGVLSPANDRDRRERAEWVEKCRTDLYSWSVEGIRHIPLPPQLRDQVVVPARHQCLLISELENVLAGHTPRLVICMPPGSAKSTYTSLFLPAYAFQRRRNMRIIGASHTSGLAIDFSGKLQELIRESSDVLSYGLRTENKERWYTTNGGAYLAAGVGQAIPGFRADCGIIDDPIKSRKSADSETDRKTVWEWFNGSFMRRLTPGAPVIIILTRWHEDDLVGRLLETQADQWRVLSLPAEAEEDDLLGRQPGEWLWDDDGYGYGAELEHIRDELAEMGEEREWSSQYQQRPRPRDGSIFRVDRIGVLPSAPAGGRTVRAYDLAATRDSGTRQQAYTVGVRMTMLPNRRIVIEHVVRARGGPDETLRLIVNTAGQDGRGVRVGIPQDPGQSGKVQVLYLTRELHGFRVDSSPESGDKEERAGPIASQVNVGNVDLVEGPWNRAFLEELAAFPSGATKDQVDALSRGYGMLLERGTPLVLSDRALRQFGAQSARDRFGATSAARNRFVRAR